MDQSGIFIERAIWFIECAVWIIAVASSCAVILRLYAQGKHVQAGRRVVVPVLYPTLIAISTWLWIIAGCFTK